jgi:hypothetical protein
MTPQKHTVLHLVAVLVGGAAGFLVGFFVGGLLVVSLLGGQHKWFAAVGMVVGMAGIGLLLDWIVRRLVPVGCPTCGGRMKCKISCSGGESYLWYVCGACGATVCPTMDFWNRSLSSLMPGSTKEGED